MASDAHRAVDAFVTAWREPTDEHREAALAGVVDEVEVYGPFGVGVGRDAALAALTNPRILGLAGVSDWSEPDGDAGRVEVAATAPTGTPIGGYRFAFVLDGDGRIVRVEGRDSSGRVLMARE